jgi:gliding motility-associated-like protein
VSGQNTRVLVTNKVGEYKVNVLDPSNGCRSSVLMRVVPGTLTASFEASAEQGYVPFSVHLDNTSHSSKNNPKFNSFWTFGNGQTFTSSIVSPTDVTFKQPGAYTVKLWIQKGGCIKEVSRIIMVDLPGKLESPNIFTPNGDGVNDVYFLHATNLDQIDFTIVDRWGNEVFKVHSTTGNIVWDGKNQAGQDMSDGVYFYKVQALGKDGQKFDQTGTITLIR